MKLAAVALATIFVTGWCAGQSSPNPAPPTVEPQQARSTNSQLTIGAGDLLEINVFEVPELTLKTRVNDKGNVSLPLVGELQVAGITANEAQERLAALLVEKDLVLHPQVSIFVAEYATQGVTIMGEVNQPGTYPLFGPHRLFEAISAAGGLTQRAATDVTLIRHGDIEHPQKINLSVTKANLATDIQIEPGDTIVVDKAPVVYVVGEVNKPGAFLMENNTQITVLRAIALAQGSTKTAALRGARIVRRTPNGLEQINLPLDEIMKAKAPDAELHPDDVVFIPTSKGKTIAQTGAKSIVEAAVGMAIYGRF
ncbi:MAG TPA: polysaccharide biosynthesis/export family protein [Candidatus Koribacter sp.]